jgi:16S rRNA (cytosine1402-N4)-methyltransferase
MIKQLKGLPVELDEKPVFELVTKKPILPSEKEILENSRSASAKLRISKKTDNS